jgi:hypothetical protein
MSIVRASWPGFGASSLDRIYYGARIVGVVASNASGSRTMQNSRHDIDRQLAKIRAAID